MIRKLPRHGARARRREAKPKVEDMDAGVNPLAKLRDEKRDTERRIKGQFEKALDTYLERVADKLRSGPERKPAA